MRRAGKVSHTSFLNEKLAVIAAIVLCAGTAMGAPTSLSHRFDTTFRAYQDLSSDPRSTRDQWLKVIRSFVAMHQEAKLSQTGRRSLFFAGRASLSLYRRSGRKADLEDAIRYLNGFVRMHRSGPHLILGLQELKEAHLLKRRVMAARSERPIVSDQSESQAGRGGQDADGKGRTSRDRSLATERAAARNGGGTGTDRTPLQSRQHEAVHSVASDLDGKNHEPKSGKAQIEVASRLPSDGSQVSLGHNCTGNPFFRDRRGFRRKQRHPVVSASLPPSSMHDAPGPASSRLVITGPPPRPAQESPPERARTSHREPVPSSNTGDAASQPPDLVSASNRIPQKYVVVIDPGHGGKDPGATSNDGKLKEKEVTLKISRRIKSRVAKKYPDIAVELTRGDDSFLALQERIAFANSLNADLFVSIHCNAAEDASSRGIETYYLSKASSRKAMASAARENGIPAGRMSDIDATLLDLLMKSKKSESVKLAESVHQSLIQTIAGTKSLNRNRGVKRAPFYVLLGAKMPAILVECGFINGKERESLKDGSFLDSLAEGIGDGIGQYVLGLGDKS